jgi:hypothetical protein
MIVNLGIGLKAGPVAPTATDADGVVGEQEQEQEQEGGGGEEEEGGEEKTAEGEAEDDYGARALLDTVIEEREARLPNEDVTAILEIVRETLESTAQS